MKKIDVHIHTSMWEGSFISEGVTFASPEQLRESYAEMGIEKGILLPIVSPETHFNVQSSEEMEYLSKKYSDLFYWCCNLDPRMGDNNAKTDFSKILMYYKERGAIGVGELTCNMYTDDPLLENLFYHCGECDMPVTIHIAPKVNDYYGIVDELHLPRLEKILKKYPRLTIVGHSQCFWAEIDGNVTEDVRGKYPEGKVTEGRITQLMREYPNLWCDLSAGSGYNALTRDTDFAYRFIEEFGDRLMFGTDICRPYQKMYLSEWLDKSFEQGCISEKNYAGISRENAIRLYKLDK